MSYRIWLHKRTNSIRFIAKAHEIGFIVRERRRERARTRRTSENIKAVSVSENLLTLTRHCFKFFAKKILRLTKLN